MTSDYFASRLETLKEKNLLRKPLTFERNGGRTVTHNGREYLLFCSNDYLGLSRDPRIIEAVKEGADRFGAGSGASRLVSGTSSAHSTLEEKLKDYMNTESVLLFNSGYHANVGAIPAVAGKGDVILADKLNHASLVDGCLLSKAEFKRYPHADMSALEKLLTKHKNARERWIVTDGIFSMDGDLAPLPEICSLARKYGARVYLDDAHAFGVMGENGRGTAEHFGVEGKIDVIMGTLGKAAGGMGAFAAGDKAMVDYILNSARTFIFSTALPPACAFGSVKAVEILSDFREERIRFHGITTFFHEELSSLGIAINSKSYIIPIVIGDADKTLRVSGLFWEAGIYIQAIRPPSVPEGTSRLRITLSLCQTDEDRQCALGVFRENMEIFKEFGRMS